MLADLSTASVHLLDGYTDATTTSEQDAFMFAASLVHVHACRAVHPDAHAISGTSLITILDGVISEMRQVRARATDFNYATALQQVTDFVDRRYTAGDNYRVTFADVDGRHHEVTVRATTSVAAVTHARNPSSNRVIGTHLRARGDVRVASVARLSLSGPRR